MNWLAIAMLMLLIPVTASAQQSVKGNWGRVSNLSAGSRVRVTARDGSGLNGSVVAVTSDSLTVKVKKQSHLLRIEDVAKVQTRSETQRLLLGAILVPVGVLAGGLIGFYGDRLLLFAAAGAASWLAPVYVTIYEVRSA